MCMSTPGLPVPSSILSMAMVLSNTTAVSRAWLRTPNFVHIVHKQRASYSNACFMIQFSSFFPFLYPATEKADIGRCGVRGPFFLESVSWVWKNEREIIV